MIYDLLKLHAYYMTNKYNTRLYNVATTKWSIYDRLFNSTSAMIKQILLNLRQLNFHSHFLSIKA